MIRPAPRTIGIGLFAASVTSSPGLSQTIELSDRQAIISYAAKGRPQFDMGILWGMAPQEIAVADRRRGLVVRLSKAAHGALHAESLSLGPGVILAAIRHGSSAYILHSRLRRLLRVDGQSDSLSEKIMSFDPLAGCATSGHIFVLGLHDRKLIHEVAEEGNASSFFDEPKEQTYDPFALGGQLACDPAGHFVVAMDNIRGQLRFVRRTGSVMVTATIPGYLPVEVTVLPDGAVKYRHSDLGSSRMWSMHMLNDGNLLVQTEIRRPASRQSDADISVQSFVYHLGEKRWRAVQPAIPILFAIHASRALALDPVTGSMFLTSIHLSKGNEPYYAYKK